MRRRAVLLAALLCLSVPAAAPAGTLTVEGSGGRLLSVAIPGDHEWCLRWNHSVTGGAVADCFVFRKGRMVLRRSYLHDFAAGLGEVEGRGRLTPAEGGGYWIEEIDEPISGNALPLRVGQPRVHHRITIGDMTHDLSALAAGQRVTLRLIP